MSVFAHTRKLAGRPDCASCVKRTHHNRFECWFVRPRVRSLKREYPVDIGSPTHSDSDVTELRSLYSVSKSRKSRRVPDTQCPECDYVVVKAKDLYHHIRSLHPDSCTYACWDCDRNFQTDHARQNHMNNQHRVKQFSCKSCPYEAAMESRMLDHVCTHTSKKFECSSCDVKLVTTKLALRQHTLLHLSKDELKCVHCSKVYTPVVSTGRVTSVHILVKSLMPPLKKLDTCVNARLRGARHQWLQALMGLPNL